MDNIDLIKHIHNDHSKCVRLWKSIQNTREIFSVCISDIFPVVPLDLIDTNSRRFEAASDRYPVVVTRDVANAENKEFTLVDGRNRLLKQKNKGEKRINIYVVSLDELKNFIG